LQGVAAKRRFRPLGATCVKAIDIYRFGQIADALDVSLDWLVGRSSVVSVMEMAELPEPRKGKTS